MTQSRRWSRFRHWYRLGCMLLLLAACTDVSTPTTPPKRTKPTPTSASNVDALDQTWLVMLYSDADDETLEEDMFNDLNEAELVGSSDRVTVVAQMDRYDGAFEGDGDWTSTKRFLIQQDDDFDHINSEELDDLGEVAMGDRDTLVDFVTWASETYPADKYVLIMSGHGTGWPGGWNDPDPEELGRDDIPLAYDFGDMLFLMELSDALEQIQSKTAVKQFELIGFDACLMSQLEVYAALTPYARYAVASQEVEPSIGWAYAAILGRLVDTPEINGAELSQAIVDSYIEQDQLILDDRARAKYVERVYDYTEETTAEEIATEESREITLTGVDLAAIPEVIEALDTLVNVLPAVKSKEITAARRYAQAFESVFDSDAPKPSIDLGNFAQLLKQKTKNADVTKAADALLAAIDRAVIDEKHGPERPGATGIAIHFPNAKLYDDTLAGPESYTSVAVDFAEQSLWDDFLAFHYDKKPLPAATALPDVADADAEAEPITIAPIQLSANTASLDDPVLIQSSVSSDNVAFVYLFIGYVDPTKDAIRVVDMDFLDPDATKEVGGVFYPDWGAAGTIDLEFEWDTQLFALRGDGVSRTTLFYPEDFGASPEAAAYTIDGLYTTAKGKKQRRTLLTFQDGTLTQVLAYSGKDDSGALRELTPKEGDRFVILEDWIGPDPQNPDQIEWYSEEGATITFGENTLSWTDKPAVDGEYVVGFIVEDFDGKWYESSASIKVK